MIQQSVDINPNSPKSNFDRFKDEFKKPSTPDGFESVSEFLRWATDLYRLDINSDHQNRKQALEDLRFLSGDQWDSDIVTTRKREVKPTITINRLPAFIGQVVGNHLHNETQIKVIPDDGSSKDAARIRSDLIRSIQRNSSSRFATQKAFENCVATGMGNFKVQMEYAHNDVFEQDAKIVPIPNALSVIWDRLSEDPSGADATHCFIEDRIPEDVFRREYPDATGHSIGGVLEQLSGRGIDTDWYENKTFRVVEFWRMKEEDRLFALMRNDAEEGGQNQVEDITDVEDFDQILERVVTDDAGIPIIREGTRKYAEMYLITATDILEGPYRLDISRLPVFRVQGQLVHVGDNKVRRGIIRDLKDPQKLLNYWRSILAENLMKTPKATWLATKDAVDGFEREYRNSHLTDDPLLLWHAEAGVPPQRITPSQFEPALVNEASMASNDMHDVSNLHQANLGQTSNEVSGRAIRARLQVGELGTAIYESNFQLSMEECGKVLNELIPVVYDTARTVKIMGEDSNDVSLQLINDLTNPESVDITSGKYSVISTTGPSFTSKRQEAQEILLNMVTTQPQLFEVAIDKIFEFMDIPGAADISRRLRSRLPADLLAQEDLTPQEQQALQAQQQAQQAQAQREEAGIQADLQERLARAEQAKGNAVQAQANAVKALSEVGVRRAEVSANVEDKSVRQFLDAISTFDAITNASTSIPNDSENGDENG